ncbi:MAG: protein-L-isoaspartate(D-aspartate) O-methyltransferase [archaeon]
MDKHQLIQELRAEGFSKNILFAMSKVDRALFVPKNLKRSAWDNIPLPIGHGQTISQPLMVAEMTEKLDVRKGQKVLEVGAGSGYQAAVLKELVGPKGSVLTVERIPELAESAGENLRSAGYDVEVIVGDGTIGCPSAVPYDRIMVTAASPDIPPPLVEQLKIGGKLAIPIGAGFQTLVVAEKVSAGALEKTYYGGCIFVPLLGEYGFRH